MLELRMRGFVSALVVFAACASMLVSCSTAVLGAGGPTGAGGTGGGPSGGTTGTGGCNAISFYPPVVTVVDATSGNPICDASFMTVTASGQVAMPDPGATPCDAFGESKCDDPDATDGGGAVCRFELLGFAGSGGYVTASAPGYVTSAPLQVYSGEGGCVGYVAADHVAVSLTPIRDGGSTDARGP